MQRAIVTIGAVILVIGLAWPWLSRLGLGQLPGDIRIEREGLTIYFPLTTCILVSAVVSVIIWLFRK